MRIIVIHCEIVATASLLPLRVGLAKVYCGEERFWNEDGHSTTPTVIEGRKLDLMDFICMIMLSCSNSAQIITFVALLMIENHGKTTHTTICQQSIVDKFSLCFFELTTVCTWCSNPNLIP